MTIAIKGLHHSAYRCRDAEETRQFYEDFLGLPLADAFEITTTQTGRDTNVLVMEPTRNKESRISNAPHKMVHARTMCTLVYVGCKLWNSSTMDPSSKHGMLIGPIAMFLEPPNRL